ncbi:hypothetical protein GOV08_05185 [Candidatus Woesearchaeota archaeon]|nr:hypothetical protein [Candidatus Woesearchaeota archaeon]
MHKEKKTGISSEKMSQSIILDKLHHISKIPKHGTGDYKQWLEQEEFLQFLLDTCESEIPLYVSHKGTYIYSVFLPQNCLRGNYIHDLMKWNCSPDSSWGYSSSYNKKGEPQNISLSPPFDFSGSKLLKKATPITFFRCFEGRIGQKSYIEVLQLLTHLNGLHFIGEKNAYCRLNEDGDIEEVIKIHHTPGDILVTMKQNLLDYHLFLSDAVLLRLFDRKLCNDWSSFREKNRNESDFSDKKNKIYARRVISFNKENLPTAGGLRGFQIIRNNQPRKKMLKIINGGRLKPQKYEKFIADDWKHDKIVSCSCDPKKLSNYYEVSDKPFEISPAFFKPDVLLKYKQNPEKYTLDQRRISCRGSWSLKTYDINKAGQVHTYLTYLGCLPHSEQLHWKSYNEKPKAKISTRAFTTDLMGRWDLSYEPLSALKKALKELEQTKPELWSCANQKLFQQLNYPVTDSLKEWTDEIHTLDKLVVEGLKEAYLKGIAISLNCYDNKLRSIKLLRKILETKGIDGHEINEIISPLEKIHFLRTKFAGHSSGIEADNIRKDLIAEHGNLRNHFRALVEITDKSIKELKHIQL